MKTKNWIICICLTLCLSVPIFSSFLEIGHVGVLEQYQKKKPLLNSSFNDISSSFTLKNSYDIGYEKGKNIATICHSSFKWGLVSFLGGVGFNFIGAGGCYIMSFKAVTVPILTQSELKNDSEYIKGYQDGYAKIAKEKNKKSAFVGGMIGISTNIIIRNFHVIVLMGKFLEWVY